MGSRCWVVVSWGTWNGASGASIGVADHCVPTKGPTQVMVETVGAGARKSVCFCDLCRWSVGCHQRLRSRWTYFPPVRASLASVESRIAFCAEAIKSGSGVPSDQAALRRIPADITSVSSPRCQRLAQRNPSRRAWYRFDSPKTGMASPVPKLRNGQPGRVSQRSWSQTQR